MIDNRDNKTGNARLVHEIDMDIRQARSLARATYKESAIALGVAVIFMGVSQVMKSYGMQDVAGMATDTTWLFAGFSAYWSYVVHKDTKEIDKLRRERASVIKERKAMLTYLGR